jgi:ferredoxin-thioredoxin reductase catalytic subunit
VEIVAACMCDLLMNDDAFAYTAACFCSLYISDLVSYMILSTLEIGDDYNSHMGVA